MNYRDVMLATRPLVYLPLGDQRGDDGAGYRNLGTLQAVATDGSGSPPAPAGTLGWTMGPSTNWPSPGQSADAVRVAHDDLMNSTTFSVVAWVRRGDTGSTRMIASRDASAGVTRFWQFRFETGNTVGLIRLAGGSLTTTATITDTSRSHMVACTVDGTAGKIYIDGREEASGNFAGDFTSSGSCAFTAGCLATASTAKHVGDMAHVGYWTRTLSPGEVRRLYMAGRNGRTIAA